MFATRFMYAWENFNIFMHFKFLFFFFLLVFILCVLLQWYTTHTPARTNNFVLIPFCSQFNSFFRFISFPFLFPFLTTTLVVFSSSSCSYFLPSKSATFTPGSLFPNRLFFLYHFAWFYLNIFSFNKIGWKWKRKKYVKIWHTYTQCLFHLENYIFM